MVPQLNIKTPTWIEEFRTFVMRGNVVAKIRSVSKTPP